MSISHLPEVESQMNQYFESQNTMALADSTKALYNAVIRKKLLPFCKEQEIDKLNEKFMDYMDSFAEFLRNKKVSAHTIQSYLTITKLLFTFHGYHIKHTYKIPRQDKQAFDLKHEKRWFSGEDIAKCKTFMFKINHIRNHLLVRLMCETGARINEIANISVCDIKLKEKAILLSWSKTTPRPVFFTPETAIYLDKHLETFFPDSTDSLTKVANRLHFNLVMNQIILETKRHQRIFSLTILDIDNFKQVNDIHGHTIGDEVLKRVAASLKDNLREQDFVARWGGEEFVIIMPDTSVQNAVHVADKLRLAIADMKILLDSKIIQVTCSFGVSEYSKDMIGEDLVKKADTAMYAAKKNGKNCVVKA